MRGADEATYWEAQQTMLDWQARRASTMKSWEDFVKANPPREFVKKPEALRPLDEDV